MEYQTETHDVLGLVEYFAAEAGYANLPSHLTETPLAARSTLRTLLTIRPPGPVDDPTIEDQLIALLTAEAAGRGVVDDLRTAAGSCVSTHDDRVGMWRGDIRRVAADVVVNPANSALLGCFQPTHLCVDNILHAAGGPSVRTACNDLRQNGDDEPVGSVLLTDAGALPATWMAHTVGPSISRGRQVSSNDEAALASCYTSVLDAALAAKATSVAFPAISTGLFAFPKDHAAAVAVEAVHGWLEDHPETDIFVLLVAFTQPDMMALADALGVTPTALESSEASRIGTLGRAAAEALAGADAVLITCGAGLSAAAGIDYTSEEIHAEFFPDMVDRGYSRMYDYIGNAPTDPAVLWGYLARQVKHVRFGQDMIVRDTYDLLKQAVGDTPYFCLTSNVDGLLHRNGHFDADRVVERQGTYSLLQCLEPTCASSPWPSEPELDRLAAGLNPDGTTSAPPPVCPSCGSSNVFLNVRGGDWFDESPRKAGEAALSAFLSSLPPSTSLVVLEIGCGFNTPTVIRVPNEQLTARFSPSATLIRCSWDHAHVPDGVLESSSILADCDAHQFLQSVAAHTATPS